MGDQVPQDAGLVGGQPVLDAPDGDGRAAEGFVLDRKLGKHLADDRPLSAPLRSAFEEHGFDVPEGAIVREEKSKDLPPAERVWKVLTRYYSIAESKLETDANARSTGRDRAFRDVLVHSNTPRTPEEMPPLPNAYAKAHYIWYAFTAVGFPGPSR